MGYYANSFEGNITITSDKLGDALKAIAEQYTEYNNDPLWGTNGKLEIPTDLETELDNAGFEFMSDTDDLVIYSYNSKWRMYTEALLRALMSVATPDSTMAFRGEDGEMWRFTTNGIQTATIVWS